MKRIEFIGASYVGKSTLFEEVKKDLRIEGDYWIEEFFINKSRQEIGMLSFWYRSFLKRFIKIIGGKYNSYPGRDNLPKEEILSKYKTTLSICFNEYFVNKQGICFAHKTYQRLLNKIKKYEYYKNIIPNKILLTEESIIHWHLAMHVLIANKKWKIEYSDKNDIGLFPDKLIFCYSDEKTLNHRMQLRVKDNRINKNHKNMSDNDILRKIWKKQEVFKKYSTMAQKKNVPVLYINTEDKLNSNKNKIIDFLKV